MAQPTQNEDTGVDLLLQLSSPVAQRSAPSPSSRLNMPFVSEERSDRSAKLQQFKSVCEELARRKDEQIVMREEVMRMFVPLARVLVLMMLRRQQHVSRSLLLNSPIHPTRTKLVIGSQEESKESHHS